MRKPTPIVQRRLAAIFCADVAGYTRLMNTDERGTLRLLSSHREMTDRLIAHNGGRIANTAGDSILAEFPSAVDALQCALGIQERIFIVHEEVPEDRRVMFRIGIHVGEAMVKDGDLFGDGVNIAARMQALAEAGAVCLSAAAYEFVHRVLPLTFDDLGPQSVKNLDTPIRAYLVRPAGRPARSLLPVHRRMDFYLARRFHAVLFDALNEVVGAEGLAVTDPPIFNTLNDAPGVEQRELAKRLGMDPQKLRRAIERLVRRGLVERVVQGNGGSRPVVRLSAAGMELHLRLHPLVRATQDRIMAPLSDDERETLQDLLARVIKANEAKAGDAASEE
jgi:class 3 adenylate cyclase/DNA-binding MarR family transcriptional regulator